MTSNTLIGDSGSAITYVIGDATVPQGIGNKIIVHICNDIGKWGRGFVLALSNKWPQTRENYISWSKGKYNYPFVLGEVQFVKVEADVWVANMIGQHGLHKPNQTIPPVRYNAIRLGLQKVKEFAQEKNASIHMPKIGSGLAGGNWDIISEIINEELSNAGYEVTVYELA